MLTLNMSDSTFAGGLAGVWKRLFCDSLTFAGWCKMIQVAAQVLCLPVVLPDIVTRFYRGTVVCCIFLERKRLLNSPLSTNWRNLAKSMTQVVFVWFERLYKFRACLPNSRALPLHNWSIAQCKQKGRGTNFAPHKSPILSNHIQPQISNAVVAVFIFRAMILTQL